jgi:transposase
MYKKIPGREELQVQAAILIAEDDLSDSEIAQRCGITRRTLMRWKKESSIQQKIEGQLRRSKSESEQQIVVERQMRIAGVEPKVV